MPAKKCPHCGDSFDATGAKHRCPSCGGDRVGKSRGDPSPNAVQANTSPPVPSRASPNAPAWFEDATRSAAPPKKANKSLAPLAVLAGAALFLLLGTVLTGYAFALTLSTPAESRKHSEPDIEPTKSSPTAPTAQPEDWRVTLADLRRVVVTPLTTQADTVAEEQPPSQPPHIKAAIDKGVAWLEANTRAGKKIGEFALAGLTLLECGVPADDESVQRIIPVVRQGVPTLMQTYEVATCIWFLDRLGQAEDKPLIRRLALRLIASQQPMAGWTYNCRSLSETNENELMRLLRDRPLQSGWRQEMDSVRSQPRAARAPGLPFFGLLPGATSSNLGELPLFQWEPGKKLEFRQAGPEDNSLTQFAILALWAARKHGIPVERSLAFAEARFRSFQNEDGSWGYTLNTTSWRDSMTCAGLLGLAVGRGLTKQSGAAAEFEDEAIKKGLIYVGQALNRPPPAAAELERAKLIARMRAAKTLAERKKVMAEARKLPPAVNGGRPGGHIVGADAYGDNYFLWSLERMAVVYDLKTLAGKDWYAWGSEALVKHQKADGSWDAGHPGLPDTCFALLFLKRVNVVKDLTAQLKLLGKVKDPGNLTPHVTLPGETSKSDEK